MRSNLFIALSLAALLAAARASAQPVPPPPPPPAPPSFPAPPGPGFEDVRPAAVKGIVTLDVTHGSVKVTGWARREVSVKRISNGGPPLQVTNDGERTSVRAMSAELEVRVPAASTVEVRGASVDVNIRDVTGALRAEIIHGDLAVTGAPASVTARTANGDVSIDGAVRQLTVRTMSGDITVRGARGTATLETVSGTCSLAGGVFNRVEMRATAGDLTFDGQIAADGGFDLRSHSGEVTMLMPATTNANFDLQSYSGSIESHLGGPRTGNRNLAFKAGTGGPVVHVQTFGGDITIKPRK